MNALTLHEYAPSGNCYKIRLVAAHLGVPLARRHYDILAGETRTAQFLAEVNADGRIPVLQNGDDFLPESNAAMWYLAHGTPLIPADRYEQAELLRWLFWEQYSHEPNIATVRFWRAFVGEDRLSPLQRSLLPGKVAAGEAALALMERHLERRAFFVLDTPTLADLALYAYSHVAEEGGFSLQPFPAVRAWLARVSAMPGHVGIDA
jgi:glutathione S-transferase